MVMGSKVDSIVVGAGIVALVALGGGAPLPVSPRTTNTWTYYFPFRLSNKKDKTICWTFQVVSQSCLLFALPSALCPWLVSLAKTEALVSPMTGGTGTRARDFTSDEAVLVRAHKSVDGKSKG